MALIKCPECGKEISDKASSCINCGFPLSQMIKSGIVKIKMPRTEQMAGGLAGLFASKDVSIISKGITVWKGKHGETASFTIDGPIKIIIDLGSWGELVRGMVEPNKRYELIQDYGFHMRAVYRLSEVDVIDSGM